MNFLDGKTQVILVQPWQTCRKRWDWEGRIFSCESHSGCMQHELVRGKIHQRSHFHSVQHDGGWVWSHASGRGCELHSYGGFWGTDRQTERAYETHSSGESMGAARAYLLPMMKPNTIKTRMMVPATATTAMMMTGFCSLDMMVAAIKIQINNTRYQL